MKRTTRSGIYARFVGGVTDTVSLEELEERMEQEACEQEADNIVLAEDKIMRNAELR